jgi:hypothetical protein
MPAFTLQEEAELLVSLFEVWKHFSEHFRSGLPNFLYQIQRSSS